MDPRLSPDLNAVSSPGARVTAFAKDYWRLEIPAVAGRTYCLAQLDDYAGKPRRGFPWRPPITLSLQGRASAENLPGTWGFGFWNDPFSLSLGFGGGTRRLPTLPNTAWFFHASPPNYLSLRDDLPAHGFLAATFSSPRLPALIMAILSPFLVLLISPAMARLFRRLGRRIVRQAAAQVPGMGDFRVTEWHTYQLDWQSDQVVFTIDGEVLFTTPVSPRGPLSLVLWIDNQYAAFPPAGKVTYGTLPIPCPAWIELRDISLNIKPF